MRAPSGVRKQRVGRNGPHLTSTAALVALALVLVAGCGNQNAPTPDTIAPARVSNLRITAVSDSDVTVTWTAPGSDGTIGTASRYDFRYLDSPMADQDWTSGISIAHQPSIAPAGTIQRFSIAGLPLLKLSYIAMETADAAGNWSAMSNQISATPGPPNCSAAPESLSFGLTPLGTTFQLSFVVTNIGGGTLSDSAGVDPNSEFSITAGAGHFGLFTGQSHTVTVLFSPVSVGRQSVVIPVCRGFTCSGTGTTQTSPFVPIQMGSGVTYYMGSPSSEMGREDDETRHRVRLTRSFEMSDHEVTQSEWVRVMNWNESAMGGSDQPVENITWFDAVSYCNKRSVAEGLTQAYDIGNLVLSGNHIVGGLAYWHPDSTGYRLLTEAEWEYVCRAGSPAAFSSGAISDSGCAPVDPNLDAVAWYCGNSGIASHSVRGKQANGFALYDFHGNVSEWCWDFYGGYPDSNTVPTDYEGPDAGGSKVVRGGNYASPPIYCRSAYRLYFNPGTMYPQVGFRIARAPVSPRPSRRR